MIWSIKGGQTVWRWWAASKNLVSVRGRLETITSAWSSSVASSHRTESPDTGRGAEGVRRWGERGGNERISGGGDVRSAWQRDVERAWGVRGGA